MDAAADAGPLATKLEARLQKVRAAIAAADVGPAAKTKRVLRKAVKRIRASEPLLRSKKARHALDDDRYCGRRELALGITYRKL